MSAAAASLPALSCGIAFPAPQSAAPPGPESSGSFVSPLDFTSFGLFLPSLHNLSLLLGYKPDKTPDKQRPPCLAKQFQGKTDSVVARKMWSCRSLGVKYLKNPSENHSTKVTAVGRLARIFLKTRNLTGGWSWQSGARTIQPCKQSNNRRCGVAQPQLLRLQVQTWQWIAELPAVERSGQEQSLGKMKINSGVFNCL